MVIKLRWKPKRNSTPNVIEIPRRPGETGPERVVTAEEMAQGLSALLWPASTVPLALAVWRMGQDLGFASEFFLQDGLASRWQIWFAAGLVMMAAARHMARWKPAPKSPKRSVEPAAIEIVREQPDGHPRRRFGNLR
jgi:hypothetical protein